MKRIMFLSLAFASAIVLQKVLAQTETNEWGPVMHGARLSLHELESNPLFNTNHCLRIAIHNVSTNVISAVLTGDALADFAFVVHSPSAKNISPKIHAYSPGSWRSSIAVQPNAIYEFPRIPILAVCPLNEQGRYTFLAKLNIALPTDSGTNRWQEVVSNPLRISLPASKADSLTNTPARYRF